MKEKRLLIGSILAAILFVGGCLCPSCLNTGILNNVVVSLFNPIPTTYTYQLSSATYTPSLLSVSPPPNSTQTITFNSIETTSTFTSTPQLITLSIKPTSTVLESTSSLDPADYILFESNFDTGNLSEWKNDIGGFVSQGSGTYEITNELSHSGNYSAALTIDTSLSSQTGSHAAYIFYWYDLPGDDYYYSAWYYIPSSITPGPWWIIWQWKSTTDGNSDNSMPVYILGIQRDQSISKLYLSYRPDTSSKIDYYNNEVPIPLDKWIHIEAFYHRSKNTSGKVIVWQDDDEIFNVNGNPTTLSDYPIYWSVNNYASNIQPNPCTIFVDDVSISTLPVGTK